VFLLNRIKTYVVYFFIVIFVLSAVQIILDAGEETGWDTAVLDEKREYMIFIEIEDKTLYLLDGNTCVKEYRIASGKSGYPSPLGSWTIVEKGDWGEGFGGKWLGLDAPWGKYGIHGTREAGSIGTAASHGCIRMFNEDVAELYSLVDIGTEVVIVNGQFGPFGRRFDEINPGDRGADVLAIQRRLKQLGYYNGPLDGIYEDGMKKAVHQFQRAAGLKAHNTIDRQTWLNMGFREFE
jgi:hypothetical protein